MKNTESIAHFDQLAQHWDDDPEKTKRAKIFAEEIVKFIKPDPSTIALEFGSGTGLLSFHLKDSFRQITLMDNSSKMTEVLEEKIKATEINHFMPLCTDLFDDNTDLDPQDIIYTLMTLHHMPDLDKTLTAFYALTKPGGYLCIADLVKEDGSFHAHHDHFDGHNGFDQHELTEVLSKNGFATVYYKICFDIEEKMNGVLKTYPLFLLIASSHPSDKP